ncbi:MAG: hypothetical protein OXB88_06060 [Bacteriovoracales bacterium]|nr:hypothetical protein [Bacteriovoracales bacterium]
MLSLERFEDLPTFLAECIVKIKQNHPRLSSLALAKKLDIPNSTFDRIIKKEVGRPSFSYALKIVQEACADGDIRGAIEKFYPEMMEDFKKTYPGNNDVPFIDASSEAFFRDLDTFEIMMRATSTAGITRESAKEEFGSRGLSILEELLKRGVLIEEGEKVTLDGKINARPETVHKLLQNLMAKSYKRADFGSHKNWLSVQYDSLNAEKAIPKIREVYTEAYKKIREIMSDSSLKGDDVVWAGMAMDSLTVFEKSINQKEEGVLQ